MNGSKSPEAPAPDRPSRDEHGTGIAQTNGATSPEKQLQETKADTVPSIESQDADLPDAPAEDVTSAPSGTNGDNEDAESEAETLITSPVKKKEAEKQQQAAVKTEPKPQRSRIGGLPVPGDDDEDVDSAESPMVSTENATPARKGEDVEMADDGEGSERDAEGSESEELSSPQSDEDAEGEEDEDVGRSEHERGDGSGADSPNPRKRKHRASSASLPNSKRRSMDPPKRRLRGMHSEADAAGMEGSASPKAHRRAVSTQSTLDHTSEGVASRKRKGMTQFPVKEPKSATGKSGWEESDASSETASRGQAEDLFKRPQRGVGRSTSTPGRPGGREHKRHVNKYGFTKLAEACEEGKLELVKEWREKDPDSLELAEFAGNKPLQIAALNGNAEVVKYLIGEGCRLDCANVDKDTPLIDAAENGHVEVVRLLLEAGVDPLSQNLKGQQALDVVTDDTDDAPEIRGAIHKAIDVWNSSSARQKREVEEETRHGAGPSKELHFMARTYENLLRLVANNDRNGVREFLAARVPVDNAVIAIAAKTGDVYLVNMLLAEMSEKKAGQRAEKPMLAVLGSSHWEMVQALTELETFNPMYRDRQGRNWPTLAEERAGPNSRQERDLLQRLYDQQAKNSMRRSSSPVSRRDGGGKRFLRRPNAEDEGSGDDSPAEARRKNGRRLMSRKDMRAASNKALSDSSDEDEEDADAEGEADEDEADVETMGPPDTPNQLRASGRTRSKSITQVSNVSPRTRRRSSSLRESGSGDKALPALDETPENAEVKKEEKEKAEEATFAIEQAQRLAAKQKEEAEAEAEAKRAEEAEAARLRAEEERKAEEERRQREAEEAEQARQKAAEEAEAERQRQLAREKEAAEAREARERKKKDLLALLPPTLRQVLHPESEFTYEGLDEKAYLVQHFTPLRVFKTADGADWVLNLQAAALVGKDMGMAMLLGEEFTLEDLDLSIGSSQRRIAEELMAILPATATPDVDTVMEDDFEAELNRTAERLNVLVNMKKTWLPSTAASDPLASLRLVKMSDIRQRLHPLLRDVNLEIEQPLPPAPAPAVKATGENDEVDFFAGMRKLFEAQLATQRVGVGTGMEDLVQRTEVAVVHEK